MNSGTSDSDPKTRSVVASPTEDRMPTIFLPHGGGPCFFMDWTMGPRDTWGDLAAWLGNLAAEIQLKPKAIVLVSAHWEESRVTVGAHPAPPLIYDYYGFPKHTYELQYSAPGDPAVSRQVQSLLSASGIESALDPHRGLDHGVFVPLKLVYPDADIPIVPLSLRADLDASFHLQVGRALAPLRDEGTLIIGSGMSFHNMGLFGHEQARRSSGLFDEWLTATSTTESTDRDWRLTRWAQAPAGQIAHPRAEHLVPLMVAAGAAEADRGERLFGGEVMSAHVSAYGFGMPSA